VTQQITYCVQGMLCRQGSTFCLGQGNANVRRRKGQTANFGGRSLKASLKVKTEVPREVIERRWLNRATENRSQKISFATRKSRFVKIVSNAFEAFQSLPLSP
jgi:hypothetical protein